MPEYKAPCHHEKLRRRIKIPAPEYVCDDCTEKLILVIPQYALQTPEQFEEFKRIQAKQINDAARRRRTGLITAEEYRQEKAKAKEGKR